MEQQTRSVFTLDTTTGMMTRTEYPGGMSNRHVPQEQTKPELVKVFRHVRNGKNGQIVSHGGITFYIEILNRDVKPMFSFSFGVTRDDENFCAKTGKLIAEGRFKAEQRLTGFYDRSLSLTENIKVVLAETIGRGDVPGVMDDNLVYTVDQKLRAYTKRLPRQQPDATAVMIRSAQRALREFNKVNPV